MRLKLVLVCMLLCSCAAGRMVETDLYFGMDKPGGGRVTDKEWADFTEKHISTVFKEGSTTFDATGTWRDPVNSKLITEPTRMVMCIHKNSALFSRQVDSLRDLYKKLFMQQSVLRVDKKVRAGF